MRRILGIIFIISLFIVSCSFNTPETTTSDGTTTSSSVESSTSTSISGNSTTTTEDTYVSTTTTTVGAVTIPASWNGIWERSSGTITVLEVKDGKIYNGTTNEELFPGNLSLTCNVSQITYERDYKATLKTDSSAYIQFVMNANFNQITYNDFIASTPIMLAQFSKVTSTSTSTSISDNSTTTTTTIDPVGPTAAVISGVINNGVYNTDVTPSWTDASGTTSAATLKKDAAAPASYTKGTAVTTNGVYQLVVTVTKTVNGLTATTIVNFTLDKTLPTATVGYSTTNPTNGDVTATITPSESVTVTNNGGLLSKVFTANGSFEFTFVDAAGNNGSVVATVNNIDKIAPVVKITANYWVIPLDGTGIVNTDFTDETGLISPIFNDVANTITLEDEAGNQTTISNVYDGPETDGLRDAVTASVAGDIIYITGGSYQLVSVLNIAKDITLEGAGSGTDIIGPDGSSTINFTLAAGKTATIQNLKVSNAGTSNMIISALDTGNAQLKYLTKGTGTGKIIGYVGDMQFKTWDTTVWKTQSIGWTLTGVNGNIYFPPDN